MKSLFTQNASLGADLAHAATVDILGPLLIDPDAKKGSNHHDSLNSSVPRGAYCSSRINVLGGGGVFTCDGSGTRPVSASSYSGTTHAALTTGW